MHWHVPQVIPEDLLTLVSSMQHTTSPMMSRRSHATCSQHKGPTRLPRLRTRRFQLAMEGQEILPTNPSRIQRLQPWQCAAQPTWCFVTGQHRKDVEKNRILRPKTLCHTDTAPATTGTGYHCIVLKYKPFGRFQPSIWCDSSSKWAMVTEC